MMNISLHRKTLLAVLAITFVTSINTNSALGATGVTTQNAPAATSTAVSDTGEQIDLYQIQISPGAAPTSVVWADRLGLSRSAWGASYATSSEIFQLYYEGKAKAAGNVYQNLRIISVCIWYTRGTARVSSEVCSNAIGDTYGWHPGPEVSVGVFDTLDWNAPPTVFNIKTTRINPNIYY
jgi:hypothetical protein